MLKLLMSAILFISAPGFSKTQATGLFQVEVGQSFPQNELTNLIAPGNTLRVRIFGGAKIKFGSVGLGWDISYTEYELKNLRSGFYHRYLWDWLFIPVSLGFINITPGIAWVVTDAKIAEIGLQEQSVRPAAVLGIGMRLGIVANFAVTAQLRGEKVWEDMERVSNLSSDEINITGEFITATVGGMLYF